MKYLIRIGIILSLFLHPVIVYSTDMKSGLKIKKRFTSNIFIKQNTKASTIILSHGSSGIWKHTFMWKDRLLEEGYNVVIIDHHKEKGIKPHVGKRDYKDFPEERVKDLLKLSRWVKNQKWNKGKIGVIGFSYGGAGTNLLANNLELEIMKEFKKKDKKLFGAIVSYYPGCGLAGGSIPHSSYVPIIIHIAEKDELVTPYLNCVEPMSNSNLTIYKYPEAEHSFDVDIPGFKYEGTILATGRKFTNVGHKESRELSIKRTLKFLKERLN
jgi:dienelactone hydrolase